MYNYLLPLIILNVYLLVYNLLKLKNQKKLQSHILFYYNAFSVNNLNYYTSAVLKLRSEEPIDMFELNLS